MRKMKEKVKKIFHTVFLIMTSVALVRTGIMFIAMCIAIYASGDQPFTRESIGKALIIMIPTTLALFITASAGAIFSFFASPKEKKKLEKNLQFTRIRLAKLCDMEKLTDAERNDIVRERTTRYVIGGSGLIFLVAALIYPVTYIFSPDRFGAQGVKLANSEVLCAFSVIILCLVPFIIYTVFGILAFRASCQREINVLKVGTARIAKEKKAPSENAEQTSVVFEEGSDVLIKKATPVSKKAIFIMQIILVFTAITFIVIGIINGGMADVFEKARKICTECIGLG